MINSSLVKPGIGPVEDYMIKRFTCRVAASFNKHNQSDRQTASRFVDR